MSEAAHQFLSKQIKSNNQIQNSENFFSSLKILEHSTATPITTILINLQLLAEDNAFHQSKSNCCHYLQRALLSANYLKEIMQHCSRPVQHKTFKVKSTLREVINICQKPNLQGQLISFLKIPGRLSLRGSRLYFQEAVICLLNNAFQAYPQHAANKLVVLFCQEKQNKLEISITDGGQGFLCLRDHINRKPKLEKIPQKGTGLSFVQSVVEDHFQGELQINSYPNRGSTIQCLLPVSKK